MDSQVAVVAAVGHAVAVIVAVAGLVQPLWLRGWSESSSNQRLNHEGKSKTHPISVELPIKMF